MKYVIKRRGSPKAILDQLYKELMDDGAKDGMLVDKRRFDAWICRRTNVASRQAVSAWIWTMENHGMVRQTKDGRIRILNPPNPDAAFEASAGRKKTIEEVEAS